MVHVDESVIAERTRAAEARLIAKSGRQAIPLNVIMALNLAVFLAPVAPAFQLMGWVFAMTLVSVGRLWIVLQAGSGEKAVSGTSSHVYLALSAMTSALWGLSAFLTPAEGAEIANQAVTLMIAGVSAAAALTASASMRLVIASTAPGLGLFAVSLFDGRDSLSMLLSVCVVVFFLIIARLSRNFHDTLKESVRANARLEVAKQQTEAQSHAMTRLAERQEAAARAAETQARAHAAVLANLRHDLRTPLNGVLGLSEVLSEQPLDEDQRRMVGRIRESGQTLAGLIDDILEVSRVESGTFELELGDVTARKLAAAAESFARPLVEAKGLAFEVQVTGEADRAIRADEARLQRLIKVYLTNAVRFTETGGVVLQLSVREEGAGEMRLRAEVHDTGCGVPESARSKLFDAFIDARMDPAIKEAGTGLGLLLVKRLSTRMGGDAGYMPAAHGEGSIFWFECSARASAKSDRYSAGETVAVDSRRLRILVADADAARCSVLLGHLRSFDCAVTTVESGEAVLEALGASAYDAVLLGLSLADDDPEAMAADIRNLASTASLTPIIRLQVQLDAPLGRSATDVLLRAPVHAESLLEALHTALESDPAAVAALQRRVAS